MAAWIAQVNGASPSGSNLSILVTYYLATDTGLTTPLGTQSITVPASASLANIQAMIRSSASDYRNSYNLITTYNGVTINVP